MRANAASGARRGRPKLYFIKLRLYPGQDDDLIRFLAGVHLVVTAQQPGARSLGDALTNFTARLLGRVAQEPTALPAECGP